MHVPRRVPSFLSPWTVLLLPLLLLAAGALSGPVASDDREDRLVPGHCHCHEGQGTYAYLRAPFAGPEDPSHCGLQRAGGNCGRRPRPPGASRVCWGSSGPECFFKRHAFSWGIHCSECWQDEDCDVCDDLIGGPDPEAGRILKERLQAEKALGLGRIVVATSKNFYVVTNLDKTVKLRTRRGGLRLMKVHEAAHVYLQRCEMAYEDFVHWFGGPVVLPKPMAVYLVRRRSELQSVSNAYFGGNEIHMNYAVNYGDRIAQGFSGNGFVVSFEEQGSDRKLHGFLRHQIGHILFSCWAGGDGFEDSCPRWAWIGAAHFLMKLLEQHKEYATYCYGESAGGEGSGKRWSKRVRDMARRSLPPIETFFNQNTLSDFSYHDHLRAWSIMDLMLREDRDRWLKLLKILRARGEEGVAFKEALGITPEQFHERWTARLTGKLKRLGAASRGGGGPAGDPSRRERESLRDATDLDVLAGRIRGLDAVKDPRVAAVLFEHLKTATDLIRETITRVLLRTQDPEVLAFLRRDGLHHPHPRVRAGVARVLGKLRDETSRPVFEVLLEDPDWLVRASAAEALGALGAAASVDALRAALDEKDPRTWLLIVDAYTQVAVPSKEATLLILPRLGHRSWQVRLLACRALAKVGTEDAMDALVKRFAFEDGRLRRELLAALRAVSHDDLGENPESWRRWWKRQKDEFGGLGPQPEKDAVDSSKGRYGNIEDGDTVDRPHPNDYFGKNFYSRRICYVLDVSDSMKINMEIDASQKGRLGGIPMNGRRMDIARHALLDSVQNLDPRTAIRLVFFHTKVKVWNEKFLVANAANKASAKSAIERLEPEGETNFHGAIKAALGLLNKDIEKVRLDAIPDTVLFLTDGRPTKGEITSMPELLSWFEWVNRFARVELHVIALGDLNIDAKPLARLAEIGDGSFIHVRESGYGGVGVGRGVQPGGLGPE